MKKTIFILGLVMSFSNVFSQLLPTGTSTIDNKYRSGGIGIGYTTLPSFGTNLFMVNGNSFFSGNIGLGTSTPSSKFHMPSGTLTIGNFFTTFDDANINWAIKTDRSIVLRPSSLNNYGSIDIQFGPSLLQLAVAKCNSCFALKAITNDVVLRGNSSGSFLIANESGGDIKFETTADPTNGTTWYNTTEVRMRIDKIGNVGIGTGSAILPSGDKLSVNGTIHTKEVRVDLVGWPDYVFEDDYKLLTLEELEKSIQENKHLPEVPSACEVEENGLELAKMIKVQQQKIEELTLYIIELNKKINELETKMD